MAKQDVLDAINATIVENGQKGITAQSLNNVLTMITENAGEGGSGDGALRVIVPDLGFLDFIMVDVGEFTPTSWAALKLELEGQGLDVSEYDAVVNASFVHNANVAKQLLEKARAEQGVSVILDQTPFSSAVFNCLKQNNPEYDVIYDEFVFGGAQPAASYVIYQKATPEGAPILDDKYEDFKCILVPLNGVGDYEVNLLYPSIPIGLNIDGSLFFEPIPEEQPSNGVVTFYADLSTDENKALNKAAYEAFVNAPNSPVTICQGNNSYIHPILTEINNDQIAAIVWGGGDSGFQSWEFTFRSDGSATID